MADPSALVEVGALGLLSTVVVAAIGMARQVVKSWIAFQKRIGEVLESMDQHLDVLTVELSRTRRALEMRAEMTPSEVPHPSPRAQPVQSIPYRKRQPSRHDK